MNKTNARPILNNRRSPLKFFALVFALSVPFWLLGAVTDVQLMPTLPVSALMAFCPMLAALILVYRENKTEGVKALLKRSFDYKRITAKVWYVPIVFLMPGIVVLSYGVMRLTGSALATPQFSVLAALVIFLAFFIGALGEELGWSGYITDPLQARWNALQASLLLGSVWAVWHFVPLMQAHRSPEWIAWWSLGTLALRVLMVWLYNNTGRSVFGMALFHAMINVCWFLAPVFFPSIAGLITAFVAAIVTVIWGPHTLTRVFLYTKLQKNKNNYIKR